MERIARERVDRLPAGAAVGGIDDACTSGRCCSMTGEVTQAIAPI
jgi:hypothetical protein